MGVAMFQAKARTSLMKPQHIRFAVVFVLITCFCVELFFLLKAETAPRVGEDEYVFVYDLRRSVKIVRGEHQSLGKLDMAGDFTPEKPFINEKRHEQRADEP